MAAVELRGRSGVQLTTATRHYTWSDIMATQTSPQPQKQPKPGPEHAAPPASHQEDALDEALDETFPSSDPIAVSIPKPSTTPL